MAFKDKSLAYDDKKSLKADEYQLGLLTAVMPIFFKMLLFYKQITIKPVV
jgi:hypothetical protein